MNGKFATIQQLLLTHIREIEDTSTQEFTRHLKTTGLKMKIMGKHRSLYINLIKDIANSLHCKDLSRAVAVMKKSGELFARQSLKGGVTPEEAVDSISFLKEVIWLEIEKKGFLNEFSVAEYHQLNQIMSMLFDTVNSQIAYVYHDYYRKAEEEQHKLAAIVDTSEDAIVSKNLDSTIMSWNRAAEKMFGYKAGEAIGKSIFLIVPQELKKEEDRIVRRIKLGGRIDHYKTIRLKKRGEKLIISLSVSPLKDSSGNVVGISTIMRNITQEKRTEQALKENRALLNTFFDNTPVGLIIYDDQNRYVRINEHAAGWYGLPVKKIIGQTVYSILPPGLARSIEEDNRHVAATKKSEFTGVYSAKFPLNSPKAKTTYWQGIRFPVLLSAGRVGTGLVSINITKQIHAQEKVRESEEKFAKAFSSNPAAISITTLKDGLFSDVNQTWTDMLGYSRQEAIGFTAKELTIWPDDDSRKRFVDELLSRGQIRGWEQEFRKKSGELFTAELSAQVMKTGGKQLVITTLIDITQRKKLERMKDDFMGVASHELKTPVTSIKAYTQILQLAFRRKNDSDAAGLLGKLNIQLDKLNLLIADLLDVTRIESGIMQFREEYFNFNSLVSEVVEEVQRTTPRHTIVRELDCDRTVFGDRERIGQVIANLLTNAVQYSPKANRVVLSTACNKETVTLCVRDFGIGIHKEKQARVFDRFYRIEEGEDTYPGLGLGLYISSEIIRREGGRIWVESEIDIGSKFYFSLPVDKRTAYKSNEVWGKEAIKA